jgi:hypothetical protein
MLNQTYNLLCSDPRDKVYRILGLVSDIAEGALAPDYTLSPQDLYYAVTKFCLVNEQTLTILCNVQAPKRFSRLPSWVPDWTAVSEVGESLGFRYSENYSAAGETLYSYKVSDHSHTLYTKDKYVDLIKSLRPVFLDSKCKDVKLEWERLAQTVSSYFTGETYLTILWQTLIADRAT